MLFVFYCLVIHYYRFSFIAPKSTHGSSGSSAQGSHLVLVRAAVFSETELGIDLLPSFLRLLGEFISLWLED